MFNLNGYSEKYKIIMVDIDNTLLNYAFAHKKALNSVARKFGFSIEDYKFAKECIWLRNLSSNHHKKELYFKIICENKNIHFSKADEMFKLYTFVFNKNLKADKTMFNFLHYVKRHNKKIIAITNFYFLEQINKLKRTGFLNVIDYLICSEEFETEKPSSILIDRALELYKGPINKEEILMIGDSIVDNFFSLGNAINYYPYNCSKLLISISGKSGCGKTFLSRAINEVHKSFIISADGYHKYERNSENWKRITHYNPEANNLIQLAMDIKKVYQDIGTTLCIPLYDHRNGTINRSNEIAISDLDIVIIEGLHTLYKEVVGNFVKIRIFIDSDKADEQKINRDTQERNQDYSKVVHNIKIREQDYKKYLEHQQSNANFLILIRKERFTIELKDILLNNYLKKKYVGEYKDLVKTVQNIFIALLSNRWLSNDCK